MPKTRLFTLGCVICVLIIATIARSFATPDKNALTTPTLSSSSGSSIGIVTGSKTGTYYIFGRDIADVAKRADIDMEAKVSEGSIDNIKRINSNENATIGIVQSDVLGFLGHSKNSNSVRMANNLRMIFPLYNEEVHVLARSGIKDFNDLQGKKVAIGENGSGNMLTAVNLFSITGVTPAETLKISPTQGVVAVLKGEADAAIFVGGKPVRLFRNLEDLTLPENQKYLDMLQKVHFIPLDNPKILEEYKPAKITHQDYNFVKEDVTTVAVPAILVSYNFADGANPKRCEQLRDLANALRAALPMLKDSGHPKWKEVDLDAKINNWKKDACVWVDLQNAKNPSLKL